MKRTLPIVAALAVWAACSSGAKIGAPCSKNADCEGGGNAVCLSFDYYPNGYCSELCLKDSDCGSGAHCELTTGQGLCVLACAADSDCRASEGYVCQTPAEDDSGVRSCLPVLPSEDGGVDGGSDGGSDGG